MLADVMVRSDLMFSPVYLDPMFNNMFPGDPILRWRATGNRFYFMVMQNSMLKLEYKDKYSVVPIDIDYFTYCWDSTCTLSCLFFFFFFSFSLCPPPPHSLPFFPQISYPSDHPSTQPQEHNPSHPYTHIWSLHIIPHSGLPITSLMGHIYISPNFSLNNGITQGYKL